MTVPIPPADRPLFLKHPDFSPRDAWVLSWSQVQGALHIETLNDMLASHARAFRENRALQYVPLIIGDREVIDAAALVARPTVRERYEEMHRGDEAAIPFDELP